MQTMQISWSTKYKIYPRYAEPMQEITEATNINCAISLLLNIPEKRTHLHLVKKQVYKERCRSPQNADSADCRPCRLCRLSTCRQLPVVTNLSYLLMFVFLAIKISQKKG